MIFHVAMSAVWGKKCVVDHIQLSTPQRLIILASMRSNDETILTTYQGGTTGERFIAYLEDALIPTLRPEVIVAMDNMRSHHARCVEPTLRVVRMIPLYLPLYSPDLNPIEIF